VKEQEKEVAARAGNMFFSLRQEGGRPPAGGERTRRLFWDSLDGRSFKNVASQREVNMGICRGSSRYVRGKGESTGGRPCGMLASGYSKRRLMCWEDGKVAHGERPRSIATTPRVKSL